MAKWPSWIVHQFTNDSGPVSHGHGWVRTRRTILVQSCNGGKGPTQCCVQGEYPIIQMTLCLYMYGRNKDISKFRAFGCQDYMYLNGERSRKYKDILKLLRPSISVLLRITTSVGTNWHGTVYSVDTEDSNIHWGVIWWALTSIQQTGDNPSEHRRYPNQHSESSTFKCHAGSVW